MPVVQLGQDQAGPASLIGLVGGYLASNVKRKDAQKQQEYQQGRDAKTDARADAAAIDTHNRITSEIAANTARTANTEADRTAKQFQEGAYGKLLTSLHGPKPPNTTAQQWVSYLQSRVVPLGLTDTDLQAKLYAAAQDYLAKDQAAQNTEFAGHEMALPGDPTKRLSVLMKRLQVEKSRPGFDVKPTEKMIEDTQKQITEAQTAAHQAAVEKRQQATDDEHTRHDKMMESRPRGGSGVSRDADGLTPYEALENRRWNQTHNPDGSPRAPSRADTTGLSNAGKELLAHDMTAWTLGGMDPASQPDPSNPKYQRRAAVSGGAPAGGGAAPGGGTKKTVSLKAAMALPGNKGKTSAQVQADIAAHGYSVAP